MPESMRNNRLLRILNRFADLMLISIYWSLLSLTVIGIGAASTAAYHAIAKAVRRDRGTLSREFFAALKENLLKATLTWLILLVFALLLFLTDIVTNSTALLGNGELNVVSLVLLIVKLFLLGAMFCYSFPLLSRFCVSVPQLIASAAVFCFRHLLSTCLMLALLAGCVWLCFEMPFLVVILPGAFFFAQSFIMEWVMQKHMEPEECEEDESVDQWYLE